MRKIEHPTTDMLIDSKLRGGVGDEQRGYSKVVCQSQLRTTKEQRGGQGPQTKAEREVGTMVQFVTAVMDPHQH